VASTTWSVRTATCTGTHLQAARAEEGGRVVTDGRLLVHLRKGRLQIADVTGERPVNRGSVALRGVGDGRILLAGTRALVIGSSTRRGSELDPSGARFSNDAGPVAGLVLVDLSDPDRPRQVAHEAITGQIVTARADGGTVRVVLTTRPDLPFVSPGANASRNKTAKAQNRKVVSAATAQDWLPTRIVFAGNGDRRVAAGPLLACTDVRAPAEDSGVDTLSVLILDLRGDDALVSAHAVGVVTEGQLVRLEPERLYVATTRGGWGDITDEWTYGGPRRKAAGAAGRTAFHEFDTTDPRSARYVASGAVQGYLPGGWAMSRGAGLLRVVTTSRAPWLADVPGEERFSAATVLAPRGGALKALGRVAGFSPGFVYGVGWFGDRAAVMTTRQAEPVQVLDLAEPARPARSGQFRLAGRSASLYPLGERRLLALNDGTDARHFSLGLEVATVDVAAAGGARVVHSLRIPGHGEVEHLLARPGAHLAVLSGEFDDAHEPGLVTLRVGDDGEITRKAGWMYVETRDPQLPYWGVRGVAPLPGGRLAALDDTGLWLVKADTLRPLGFTKFPPKPKGSAR
jgi:hypothetical protein